MKARSIFLWGLGIILLVPLLGAVLLFAFSDSLARWALERALKDDGELQVHFDGDVSLEFGSNLRLSITDLWISNPDWAENEALARIGHGKISVALRPLLSGTVFVHRLVVSDFDLNLEIAEDGRRNWDILSSGDEPSRSGEFGFAPIFQSLSITDAVVSYDDRAQDEFTQIVLETLEQDQAALDQDIALKGGGRVDGTPFRIEGYGYPLEDALAAKTAYPFRIDFLSDWLTVSAAGTARDLAAGDGFDIDVSAEAQDIAEVFKVLKIDAQARGHTTASTKLTGNLGALAAENIVVEIAAPPNKSLRATGRIASLESGRGLDIVVKGVMSPAAVRALADLPEEEAWMLEGIDDLEIAGEISGDFTAPQFKNVNLALEEDSGARITIAGEAQLNFKPQTDKLESLTAQAKLDLPDEAFLNRALGAELPALGALQISAAVAAADGDLKIDNGEVEAELLPKSSLTAQGNLGHFDLEDFALTWAPELDVTIELDQTERILLFIPKTPESERPLPKDRRTLVRQTQEGLRDLGYDPGPIDGLTGPRTNAAIEAFERARKLPTSGLASEELLREIERELGRRLDDQRSAEVAQVLTNLGPGRLSGRLSGKLDALAVADIDLRIGQEESPILTASGNVGALRPDADPVISGLDLQARLAIPSSRIFEPLLSDELPELTGISGPVRVTGTENSLALTDASLSAKGPAKLAVKADGGIARLDFAPKTDISGIVLDIAVSAPESAPLFDLTGLEFEELGPIDARATISGNESALALRDLRGTIGQGEVKALDVTGSVGDLFTLQMVRLSGTFESRPHQIIKNAPESDRLGTLYGRFDISDDDGALGIDRLEGGLKHTELLELSVRGVMSDIQKRDGLDFDLDLRVPDVSLVVEEFGGEGGPSRALRFVGALDGRDENFNFDGDMTIGKSKLTGKLSGRLEGERPILSGDLSTDAFYLDDLGLEPEEADYSALAQTKRDADERVFTDTPLGLEALREFDLALRIRLAQIRGVEIDIQRVRGSINLKQGVLDVTPTEVLFVGGNASTDLHIDASRETPTVRLNFLGDNINLDRLLSQTRVDAPLNGTVDVQTALSASGNSARDLASSATGQFDVAVANGRVLTSLLDLTGVNIWSWMLSESRRRGYSRLNCLIAHFTLDQGVAKTDSFLIDTDNVQVTGTGSIDLKKEMLDLQFEPRPKRRRLIESTTSFSLVGPLSSPDIEVGGGAARRVVSDTLVSPINFLGSLLPFVGGSSGDEDNPCLERVRGDPHP